MQSHLTTIGMFALAVSAASLTDTWSGFVWLAPFFTLLYLTRISGWLGFLLLVTSTAAIFLIQTEGVIPIPDEQRYVMAIVASTLGCLPFALQLSVKKHLPGWLATLVLPTAWVVLEFVGSSGPFGTWGANAYTQFGNFPIMQLASLTGIWGFTFLIHWFASTAWWLIGREGQLSFCTRKDSIIGLVAFAVAAIFVVGFGYWRINQTPTNQEQVTVGCVASPTGPTPLEDVRKWIRTLEENNAAAIENQLRQCRKPVMQQFDKLLASTEKLASAGARLVVWSEAALVTPAEFEPEIISRCQDVARKNQSTLVVALAVYQPAPPDLFENKTIVINELGEVLSNYHKARIVPGEQSIKGDGHVAVNSTNSCGNVASIICFDADFPDLVRQISSDQSRQLCEVLAVSANDWIEVQDIHLELCAFRAVENGTWIVRSTSNGMSAIISPLGEIIGKKSSFVDDELFSEHVGLWRMETVYSKAGDAFAFACIALLPVLLLGSSILALRKRSKKLPNSPTNENGLNHD